MATDFRELVKSTPDADDSRKDFYDRSSLKGDYMVMIPGQTKEEYLRRSPEKKSCEYIDGVVYLHPSASKSPDRFELPTDPEDPMRIWYDRSSLVGDFTVMIPDQTDEDYLRRAPEYKFCEYIDGIVCMPAPPNLWHQFGVLFLSFLLEGFTVHHRLGHALMGPASLRIAKRHYLEPDLFVVPYTPDADFQGFYVDPPALMVVEVLSRSSRSNDLNRKAELYHQAEVIEIWFVDDRDQVLIIHRRTEQGYDVERIKSGLCHSRALPGFWFEFSWLWERPRPNVVTCLQAILAGPPA
jgi:Uma2 family endonuclease